MDSSFPSFFCSTENISVVSVFSVHTGSNGEERLVTDLRLKPQVCADLPRIFWLHLLDINLTACRSPPNFQWMVHVLCLVL